MADTEKLQDHHSQQPEIPNFSLRIWPPSQRTRDAVIRHLIQTLSSPSTLTNRYSTLSPDDAAVAAKSIEEASFATSSASDVTAANADEISRGIEILQVYSKEIGKRMLETVKRAKANASHDGAVSSEKI